jgi:hypothetical protein
MLQYMAMKLPYMESSNNTETKYFIPEHEEIFNFKIIE